MRFSDDEPLDLKSVRCFVLTASMGSLTSAASALGLAQSALSRHVAQLERALGGPLFHRTGRGVTLTEMGRTALPRAQFMLEESRKLIDEANTVHHQPTGIVTVGILPSLSRPMVSRTLARLRQVYPGIHLRAFEAYSGEVENMLTDGRIDIGIFNRYRPLLRESQDAIFSTSMCLVGRPDAPAMDQRDIRFAAVAGLPLALPCRPNSMRSLFDEISNRRRLQLQVVLEASTGGIIKDALLNSHVYSVLPPHAVMEETRTGALRAIPIRDPDIRQVTFIDTTRKHPMTNASRAVLAVMTEQLRNFGAENSPASMDQA